MKSRFALAIFTLLLAGCGGGGGGSTPATPAKGAQTASVPGSVVFSIPTGGTGTSARARYPQFVSPNASSIAMNINGGSDTFFDVSPTSSLCVTASGGRNCTLHFSAPPGTDTFGFLVFNGQNGTGAQLAAATSSPQTIVAGQGFTFNVALNAMIGTVIANVTGSNNSHNCQNTPQTQVESDTINEGCSGSGTLTIVVQDPSGATVTGTDPFATPITITGNDPSVSASPSTITHAGQTSLLSYTGAAFGPSITNQITATLTIGTVGIPVNLPVVRAYLYVANSNAPFGTQPAGGGNVAVYTFGSSGSATPARVITSVQTPAQVLVDSGGFLFVLDDGIPVSTTFHPSIKVYAPGATGNATPVRTISNIGNVTCSDMTLDPTKTVLFVSCGTEVYLIPASFNGTFTISTGDYAVECGDEVTATAFDQTGNLIGVDTLANIIGITPAPVPISGSHLYCPGSSMDGGSAWPSTIAPLHIYVDASGTLYAPISYQNATMGAPDNSAELAIWNMTSICNNCGPSATLVGTTFTTHAVVGVTLDWNGNVYVINPFTNTVSEFAQASVATASLSTNLAPMRTLTVSAMGAGTGLGMTVGP